MGSSSSGGGEKMLCLDERRAFSSRKKGNFHTNSTAVSIRCQKPNIYVDIIDVSLADILIC